VKEVGKEGERVTPLLGGLDVKKLLVARMERFLTSLLVVDEVGLLLLLFDASEQFDDLGLDVLPA
jgi:hypothetical protein